MLHVLIDVLIEEFCISMIIIFALLSGKLLFKNIVTQYAS